MTCSFGAPLGDKAGASGEGVEGNLSFANGEFVEWERSGAMAGVT